MTADREALVAEVAGVVTTASPGTPTLTALKIADALADLLAAREQQARAEAWNEGSRAMLKAHGSRGELVAPNPYLECQFCVHGNDPRCPMCGGD